MKSVKNAVAKKTPYDAAAPARKALMRRLSEESLHLSIGPEPQVSRNKKMEGIWKELLAKPPINHSDPNHWRAAADVRPSSFPFCSRRYVFQALGLVMPSDFTVESCYYTEIGKAVHYVVQNAIATTGRLWGRWKCCNPKCSNDHPQKWIREKPSFLPEACPHCGLSRMEYEELRLEDPEIGLRGHTDGIIVRKDGASVLEVKTVGQEKLDKLKSYSDAELREVFQTEAPFYGYWHQASTYAVLANRCFPQLPPIDRVEFFIHSRDSPGEMVAFTLEVQGPEWYQEIRARVVMAQQAKSWSVLPVGFAQNHADLSIMPSCTYCAYKEVCLNPEGKLRFAADAMHSEKSREALDEVYQIERKKPWAESSEATS